MEIKIAEGFHSGVAEDLTLLEYDTVSICNQTVSQVRKGDTPKEGNKKRSLGKTEADGEMYHMKWKCIGGG